jgi:hypothetical protein
MDRFETECHACTCKKAAELRREFDVWFNCTACPYSDCYEPETRERFLNGVAKRESKYDLIEKKLAQQKKAEEEYKTTEQFRRKISFAETIRKKVKSKTLLSKREFAKALRLCQSYDAEWLEFYAFEDLVKYQLSLLGYENAAVEICEYISKIKEY